MSGHGLRALGGILKFNLVILTVTTQSASAQLPNDKPTVPPAQQQKHTLEREVSHRARIQYLLFLPKAYAGSADRWPLILYLHGGSLRGNDIDQMTRDTTLPA